LISADEVIAASIVERSAARSALADDTCRTRSMTDETSMPPS
jgi:hypothetical protein